MITTLIEREAEPILISDLTWREFKAVEQLIDRPGLLKEKVINPMSWEQIENILI